MNSVNISYLLSTFKIACEHGSVIDYSVCVRACEHGSVIDYSACVCACEHGSVIDYSVCVRACEHGSVIDWHRIQFCVQIVLVVISV